MALLGSSLALFGAPVAHLGAPMAFLGASMAPSAKKGVFLGGVPSWHYLGCLPRKTGNFFWLYGLSNGKKGNRFDQTPPLENPAMANMQKWSVRDYIIIGKQQCARGGPGAPPGPNVVQGEGDQPPGDAAPRRWRGAAQRAPTCEPGGHPTGTRDPQGGSSSPQGGSSGSPGGSSSPKDGHCCTMGGPL